MKTLNSRITLTLFILVSSHLLAMAGDVSFKVTKKYLNFPVSHAEIGRNDFECKRQAGFVRRYSSGAG